MRSFHQSNHFSAAAVELFHAAQRIVRLIPDPAPGADPWRCHEVARVVGDELALAVVDGTYGAVDHSWLVILNGTGVGDAILDVYAAGVLPQVLLVDTFFGLPSTKNYRPGEVRKDVMLEAIEQMRQGVPA